MRPSQTSRELVLPLTTDEALRRRFLVVRQDIPGNLRFGVLLEELDRLAALTSLDYIRAAAPGAGVVTAAVDEIIVRQVVGPDQDLTCRARINRVGRSSMEVGLRVEGAGGGHLASCYFTMVARRGDGPGASSIALPPLEEGDALERRRDRLARERQLLWRGRQAAAGEPPSREEFEGLAERHRAQDGEGFGGLRCGALALESWERTYPEQENPARVIFGGYLMRRAYELATIAAERVAPDRALLVAVNRVNFLEPVQIGDKLRFTSAVVYTEGPAVVVQTSIQRHSRDRTVRALSNSCLFTFMNAGPALDLRPVPEVFPATYAEDARWLDGRRNLRAMQARVRAPWLGLRG